jgi:hypothetical protein
MKKLYTLLFVLSSLGTFAQSFSDNFDAYTAGSYLGVGNANWTTWSGSAGGADDVKISTARAKSGNNALYFSSVAGGPVDVVLPFGGEHTTGTMNLSMSLFVESNKKAYFNLQEQTLVGKGWSVDANFDSSGTFTLVNTLSGLMLSGSYTQNSWIKVEFRIDLNTNTWNFLIDGTSKGTFQNLYRKIASLNIYAISNSAFHVDDVSFAYTAYTKPNLNAAVTFIGIGNNLAGLVTVPTVEVRNLGTQVITAATIELTYNNVTQTKIVTGLNLTYLALGTITLDNSITLLAGISTVTATVKLVNGVADDISADNTKNIDLYSPTPAPGKVVVAEEATGTWCQWCPRGAVWLKKMDTKYGNLIIGIAVHNNDPMTFSVYDKGLAQKISGAGYPSVLVDRGTAIDPSAMESDFMSRILMTPKGTIRNGAKYNSTTRTLDVSLTTKFSQAVSGNYRIAFVLVEDSVTGTAAKYAQSNAYAGGGSGPMGGFELLPNPVPANKMVYDHVGRIIAPNFAGLPNAFAAAVNPGDSFTHNFSVVLDPAWRTNKLHVVGLLIDPSGKVENGSSVSMDEAVQHGFVPGTFVTGIVSRINEAGGYTLYPNPSAGNFILRTPLSAGTVSTIEIYDVQGKLMETQQLVAEEQLIDAHRWTPGIYFGVIHSGDKEVHIKFNKQ